MRKTYKKETYLQNYLICRQVSSFAMLYRIRIKQNQMFLHQYVDPVTRLCQIPLTR